MGDTSEESALIMIVWFATIYAILYEIVRGIDRLNETIGAVPIWDKEIFLILLIILLAVYIRSKWQIAKIRRIKKMKAKLAEEF